MESPGVTVWLTGLSGAGKSTIARHLAQILVEGGRPVEVLDGDEVRQHLSHGLGFDKASRDTNVRRIGYVAKLLTRHGIIAITAAISPYRAVRDEVRQEIGAFVEVYVQCSLDELVRRDVKGLYARALRGEIANFTGVSDPYEAPLAPEVVVDSEYETVTVGVNRIMAFLEQAGYLTPITLPGPAPLPASVSAGLPGAGGGAMRRPASAGSEALMHHGRRPVGLTADQGGES